MFEREYYSLEETAKMLCGIGAKDSERNAIIKDFIQLAVKGEIHLIKLSYGLIGALVSEGGSKKSCDFKVISELYLKVPQNTMAEYEAAFDIFNTLCFLSTGLIPDDSGDFYQFDDYEGWIFNNNMQHPLLMSSNSLHIFARDIKAYLAKKGLAEANSFKGHPKNIRILYMASEKFWANANQEEKDTWPKNSEVEAWFKTQGISKQAAKIGASFIRPDWAKGKK
jgi:hypothetical protein